MMDLVSLLRKKYLFSKIRKQEGKRDMMGLGSLLRKKLERFRLTPLEKVTVFANEKTGRNVYANLKTGRKT